MTSGQAPELPFICIMFIYSRVSKFWNSNFYTDRFYFTSRDILFKYRLFLDV